MAQQLVLGSEASASRYFPIPESSFQSFDKLRQPLHSTAGAAGSATLLARALALTKTDFPRLESVSIGKKGVLEGLATIDPPLTQQEADEGEILLVGNTVELLCLFLGEALALSFIKEQWPDASFVDEEPSKEGNA